MRPALVEHVLIDDTPSHPSPHPRTEKYFRYNRTTFHLLVGVHVKEVVRRNALVHSFALEKIS